MFGVSMRLNLFQGLGIALGSTFVLSANCALGQIVPDGTLPNNSIININGNTFNITGGTQAGTNLFHSFKDFSVPTGGEAFFNNAVDIGNIISRVTGGSVSNIDGLIRTLGTANLFLINPNGIIFGQNASLNVGGSFVASTANAIQFGDIGFFSATNPEAPSPLLTINPSALVSNQIAAAIQNNSTAPAETDPAGFRVFGLRVPDGKSLLLVGGNVNMDGGWLNAYGGRVELGGLASAGTVELKVDGNNLSLGFPDNVTRSDVSLTNGANVYVEAAGGGSIAVNARNIDILGGSYLNAGIGYGLGSVGTVGGDITLNATGEIKVVRSYVLSQVGTTSVGNGGNINVTAGSLSLTDGASLSTSTFGQGNAGSVLVGARDSVSLVNGNIFSLVESGGVGKGGNINITAASLSLLEGAQLSSGIRSASSNFPGGRGDAGNVNVDVTGTVTIAGVKDGFSSGIFSQGPGTGALGNGGSINLTAGSLSVTDGARVSASTFGQGNAGNVLVQARDSISLVNGDISSSIESGGVGKGGNINIIAASLSLLEGAQLSSGIRSASSNFPSGRGDAGNVNVNVTGAVTIAGVKDGFPSGAFSSVGDGAVGRGGSINLTAGSLFVTNGAQVSASTGGLGDAGNLNVNVSDFVILSSTSPDGQFPSSLSSAVEQAAVGNGGDINFKTGRLLVRDGAAITVSNQGAGNAGNLNIASQSIRLDNQGQLTADSVAGAGGNFNLNIQDLLLLRRGSLISNTSGTAQQGGKGGNLSINIPNGFIVAVRNENNDIITNSFGGSGGDINITAFGIFNIAPLSRQDLERLRPIDLDPRQLSTNDIIAISQTGPLFDINSFIINLGLVELPILLADTAQIADTSCAAFANGESSSFTVTGRGGLPPNPYEPLTTDVVWADTRIPNITSQQRTEKPFTKPPSKDDAVKILPATGWVFDGKGNVTLISHASNANLGSTPACQKK